MQLVRKGIYLRHHPDMEESKNKFLRLVRAGWRNPLTDCEHIMNEYSIQEPDRNPDETVSEFCRRVTRILVEKQKKKNLDRWCASMHYGRLVISQYPRIHFPALKSIHIESWVTTLIRNAAEEQVHGLGANPAARRKCRMGCNNDETAYHVAASCITPAYASRHDYIVFWILKSILQSTQAPEQIQSQLNFRKANLVVEYNWNDRNVKIQAGVKVRTEPELYHNRPDIIVTLTNPNKVYVFEIAVAHLQNVKLQEDIKRTRYAKNSMTHVTHENVTKVPRNYNIIEALSNMYKCTAQLAVFVFGAFGEIIETEEHKNTCKILSQLGINYHQMQNLLNKCSLTAANETAKIIIRRLGVNKDL